MQKLLQIYSNSGDIDVIIAGAGKAAHLPGCIDAYLRNHLHDKRITVIGVGFTNKNPQDNQAAALSITQVPGTQVLFAGLGSAGFYNACITACERELPAIKLLEIPPELDMALDQAIGMAIELDK